MRHPQTEPTSVVGNADLGIDLFPELFFVLVRVVADLVEDLGPLVHVLHQGIDNALQLKLFRTRIAEDARDLLAFLLIIAGDKSLPRFRQFDAVIQAFLQGRVVFFPISHDPYGG